MASGKEYALLCLENPLLGMQYSNGSKCYHNTTNREPKIKTYKDKGKHKTLPSRRRTHSIDDLIFRDEALLSKYGLKANDAILAEEKHMDLYEDLLQNHDAKLIAGGAAQNTARGAQVSRLPSAALSALVSAFPLVFLNPFYISPNLHPCSSTVHSSSFFNHLYRLRRR